MKNEKIGSFKNEKAAGPARTGNNLTANELQKAVFRAAKHGLLRSDRRPPATPFTAFRVHPQFRRKDNNIHRASKRSNVA